LRVICAAGGQQEHHTFTQTRSGGVIETSANRRQHIKGDFGLFFSGFFENYSIFTVFIDLCRMVIWNLSKFSLAGHLIAMYMTISLMVIDAQEMLAARKPAFSANRRSF